MIIKRNSWHYKIREKWYKYKEWHYGIEDDGAFMYIATVILAILFFWQRDSKKKTIKFI